MRVQILTAIYILFLAVGAFGQELDLADAYFKQGEYEKAAEYYKKLSGNKDQARLIHDNYLSTLYKLKDYDTADKYVKALIKNNPNGIVYKADLIQIIDMSGKTAEAELEYNKLIEESAKIDAYVYELQNFFYKANKIDLAIKLLLTSREKSNNPTKFDTQLARWYLFVGRKDKMLEEVFGYGQRSKNFSYVQATIQDNIREEAEIEMLEAMLYAKIQENPNETFFNEILIWHFTQKQDFARAFIQARAIDKRNQLEGMKVFELAGMAYTSKDFKNASRMYQYVMDEYPGGDFYIAARRWLIQSKEELIKNTFPIDKADIKDLLSQYNKLISELGIGPNTMEALRNMALLHAFYLDEHDKAIEILETAIKAAKVNTKFRDQCKLDLGDIYILKNEPWESTLLYMQVEKSQKEDNLGEIAKLKNARLQYYTGQFELSKDILDILKKATTREIANDALQLSLLIQDNTGLDTSEVAMSEFAKVDLLIFQNKYNESIKSLEVLAKKYETHSLADEILWLKANTLLKINRVKEAVADLEQILKLYQFDILADDALFLLAKIKEENQDDKPKAMELYRQLLKDYPGSIYGAQSRIRFRELRGDFVN
jgi:tetratricopeptide (TPR) repeat protein